MATVRQAAERSPGGVHAGATASRDGLLRAASFAIVVLLFGAADVLRTSAVRTATVLSMGGWLAFAVLFLAWAWRGMDVRAALGQSGRIATLTAVAFAVLLAYYLRSGLIDAGPHTDAVFTFLGLRSFVRLENPITFAGRTPSFPQAALMLLAHLPGVAIGFDALGALAIPLGAIVHLALLFAVATDLLVGGSLRAKAAVAALVSGMYSNRLLVFTYDITGYAFPAVCLALMFVVLVLDRIDDPNRAIGGLLAVALLHHYPGFFMVLPLCLLWLVAARAPWRRLRRFVADNPVVIAVVAMLAITLVTNPELMLNRVKDVTVGASGVDVLLEKNHDNMAFVDAFGRLIRFQFFTNARGSWFLVNVPALGGLVGPFVVGSWLLSWWTARRRARHLWLFLTLGSALGTLTVLQDLVTDSSDYRQFPFLFAMCTAGLAFAFRIPELRVPWRVAAVAYAIAFAAFNYVDLANLQGRTRGVDSAYRSQASMDALWRFVDRPDAARRLGADRIFVVVDPFFPLEPLYLEVIAPKAGVPVTTIPVAEACPQGRLSADDVSRRTCESVLVVANARHCAVEPGTPAGRPAVRGALYESICDRRLDRAADRSVVDVDLDGGRRT
jgi:hypothetical protein